MKTKFRALWGCITSGVRGVARSFAAALLLLLLVVLGVVVVCVAAVIFLVAMFAVMLWSFVARLVKWGPYGRS
jgi:hypothetical protein